MAISRVNFLAYVKRYFKRTDKDDEIYEAQNETVRDILKRDTIQEYAFQSWVPTVDAQEDYPLPADLLHLHHPVRLLEGSGTNDDGWPLDHITKEEYDLREPNPNRTSPATSTPRAYAVWSNSILLTPIPDSNGGSNYLIEINWGNIPTDLSNDADVMQFSTAWEEIVKWGCLYRLYASVKLYQDAQYWEEKYERGLKIMTNINKDKRRGWVDHVVFNSL